MQITASTMQITTITQNQPNPLNQQPLTEIKADLNSVHTPSAPDVNVLLAQTRPEPVVYEQPYVDLVQLRNAQDEGKQASKVSQQLSSELSNIRSKKSPFSVKSFFSQIGALSRETSEYKNEARSTRMLASKVADAPALDFNSASGSIQEMVTLRVQTKDGDTISIKLQHNKGTNGDGLSFSFVVDGKLSVEEQDALEKLANKFGEIGDEFFRTGSTALNGLAEFDKTQLKDFQIEFRTPKASGGDTTLTYDYSVDENTNTQHLIAKDGDDYRIDITTQLNDALGISNSAFNQSLNIYMDIIRNSLDKHQTLSAEPSNWQSKQFILDSFSSMLTPNKSLREAQNASVTDKALAAFSTGLPDFNAKINAPLFQDNRNPLLSEALSLKLQQSTHQEQQTDGRLLTKQVNSWQQSSSRITGVRGSDKGDLETGNYVYKTIQEEHRTTRILDSLGGTINNMITEQTHDINNSEKTYFGFRLKETNTDQRNDHQIKQLTDEMTKHKNFKQMFDGFQYLEESTKNLFN